MDKFFADQAKRSKPTPKPSSESTKQEGEDVPAKKSIPKGVVLGEDGKPYVVKARKQTGNEKDKLKEQHQNRCRSCTSFADWAAMTKSNTSSSSSSSSQQMSTSPPSECPPDVNTLGNNTWTLLHTITATYPLRASPIQQSETRQFLHLFSKWYPCWVCADDFRAWMQEKGNEPRVEGREGFGRWMCEAHNEVNRKLGKKEFDCNRWEERWRTGGDGC